MNLLIATFTKQQKLIAEIGILYNIDTKSFDDIKLDVYKCFDKWITYNHPDCAICKVMWISPNKQFIEWRKFKDGFVACSNEFYTPMYLVDWKNIKRITPADYVK